jgi:GntR family transcriptional regulator
MSSILFSIQPGGEPIFQQLVAQVRALRAGGRLRPGELLPSVRRVAEELAINPMTVSRAWSQLEQERVVETVRGLGMRVLPLPAGAPDQRLVELDPALDQVVRQAQRLALDQNTVITRLRRRFTQESP